MEMERDQLYNSYEESIENSSSNRVPQTILHSVLRPQRLCGVQHAGGGSFALPISTARRWRG